MKVVVIEPEAVTTRMLSGVDGSIERIIAVTDDEQRCRYERLLRAVVGQAAASVPGGVPSEKVAKVIADAIASKRPLIRYSIGREVSPYIVRKVQERDN